MWAAAADVSKRTQQGKKACLIEDSDNDKQGSWQRG